MNQINAIAGKMIQEAMRLRTPFVSLLFVITLLVYFPFSLRGDGTALGMMKLILHYSLLLLFTLLALQSIYLSTLSFDKELKQKYFFLIDIKPIPRWKFFVGKLWGLTILNFFLLVILGTIIWLNMYLFSIYQVSEEDKKGFGEKLYTSSVGVSPFFDYEALERDVERRFKRSFDEGNIPAGANEIQIKNELRNTLREINQYVSHEYSKLFVFQNIPTYLRKYEETQIRLRYKIYSSNTTYAFQIKTRWIIGKHTKYEYKQKTKVGEFNEFTFPANAIDENGRIEIYYSNNHEEAGTIYFPIEDGLELLYPQGSFIINFVKFLILTWMILILLSSLSLFCSTFLSFPVAILTSLFTLFLGVILDFFREIVTQSQDLPDELKGPFHDTIAFIYTQIFNFLYFVVPNFSEYMAFEYITTGRYIEWLTILKAFVFLIIIDTGVLIAFGCYIFRQREVARPLI